MKRNLVVSMIVCCFVAPVPVFAQASQPVSMKLPDSRLLQMSVPETWKVEQSLAAGALNVRIVPAGKGDFMILLTVLPATANRRITDGAALKKVVQETGTAQLSGALQKQLDLAEIKMDGGIGYLYHITDRNPEKGLGDYREGNQGMIMLGDLLLAVTVLSHTGDDAIVAQAFDAFKTLRIAGNVPKPSEPDRLTIFASSETYDLTVPVSRLLMSIPKEGFIEATTNTGGATASKRYFYLEGKEKHIVLSGWFEAEQEFPGTKKAWNDTVAAWTEKKIPLPAETAFKKIGNWDAVVYQMSQARGSNAHIRANWVEAGTWIDLHLSIDSDRPKEENVQILESLLSRIRVTVKN